MLSEVNTTSTSFRTKWIIQVHRVAAYCEWKYEFMSFWSPSLSDKKWHHFMKHLQRFHTFRGSLRANWTVERKILPWNKGDVITCTGWVYLIINYFFCTFRACDCRKLAESCLKWAINSVNCSQLRLKWAINFVICSHLRLGYCFSIHGSFDDCSI